MVALNFPASPSNGDEFQGYVYDSTLQVWNRKPNTIAYTVSPTVPANPNDGDVWFNEQDGSSYIYYIDEDSEQWVEIGGKVGATGSSGVDGIDGIDGVGIPAGGTTGQALSKTSGTDYDTQWVDISTSLEGLTDTNITTPADGQALVYDDATSKWLAGDVASGPLPAKTIASDSINIDFSDGIDLETRAVAGDVTFTASNYTSGVKKTIYLEGDTVKRSLTFPATWNFITDTPTDIGANKKNLLDLNSFGTSESTTVALWLGVSAFEPIVATGGVVSTISVGGVTYKVHTFASTGSSAFAVSSIGSDNTVEYLAVAGGGGGGGGGNSNTRGGGGGAGGFISSTFAAISQSYSFVVGGGGAASAVGLGNVGGTGSTTSIFGITLLGGGGGGSYAVNNGVGVSGGSGGGGGTQSAAAGGTSINGRGNSGGTSAAYNNDTSTGAGGGGGFGSVGENGNADGSGNGGDGGLGIASAISGSSFIYAAGGGGGGGLVGGSAESGGGAGGSGSQSGFAASANTGSGGGGASAQANNFPGGPGGSGVIIVRYPITDPN